MGSLCCSLIHRDNSSQIYFNEGLVKTDNEHVSITHNNIPYKCIIPVSSMSQSKISYYSQLSSSQYSNNNQPMNMEVSINNSYRQNTIDANFGSIRPVDHQLFQFVDFPFLTSMAVIKWMLSTRIIFIFRGPSGSGKSTIVECLKDKFPNAVVCSSDFYFMQNNGTMKLDRSKLKEADNWCQNQIYQALESGKSPVIIDNPHIRCWEYKYNVDLSIRFDYLVMIVVPKTPWRFDVEQLHEKSTKSEPIWEIEKSINEFEPAIPLYFGWFLNDADSDNILQFAHDTLDLMINIPEIRLGLAAACDLPEFVSKADLVDHWTMKTERLHVTTKFCGYGSAPDAETYLKSGAVQESLYQLFPIHIKGLLLTPRTFSGHMQLAGPKQIQLWAGDDQEDVSAAMNKYGSKPTSLSKKTGIAKLNGVKQTRRPFGCRAHVALMYAEGTKPVQSGLDQLQIIDLQLQNEPSKFVAVVEAGNIIEWGQGRYYLELNYPIICQAIFTGQY